MVEENHEGDDEDFLLKHKRRKMRQSPSYASKVMAKNNLETLTSWFY
jgi:hypothetical protein